MKKVYSFLTLLLLFLGGATGARAAIGDVLVRTGWTVTASSECDDASWGHASAIIDGNSESYWHSNWGGDNAKGIANGANPHWFIVDMGAEYDLGGISYQARTGLGYINGNTDGNGAVKEYAVYVSTDAFSTFNTPETATTDKDAVSALSSTLTPAATGTFDRPTASGNEVRQVAFSQKQHGRYILFVSKSSYGVAGDAFANCAEFNAYAYSSPFTVGTALTTTTISGISSGQYYILRRTSNGYTAAGKSVTESTVGQTLKMTTVSGETADGYKAFVKLTGDNTNGYTIQFAASGNYMPACVDGTVTAGTTAAKYKFVQATDDAEGVFEIMNVNEDGTTGSLGFDAHENEFCGWQGKGNQSKYEIVPVTLADGIKECTVTYSYLVGDKILTTQVAAQKVLTGSTVTPPTVDYITVQSYTPKEVSDEATTVTVTCAENLPFTASESYDNAVWYQMDMHANDPGQNAAYDYIWKYVADADYNVQLPQQPVKDPAYYGDTELWCFVGDVVDGFTIYNKAAGAGYTLRVEDNNSKAVMVATSTAATETSATKFKLVKSAITDIANQHCFLPVGQTNYVNTQAESGVKVLKRWENPDGGSSIRFHAPDEYMLNYAADVAWGPANALGVSKYFDTAEKTAAYGAAYHPFVKDGANHFDLTACQALSTQLTAYDTWHSDFTTNHAEEADTVAAQVVDGSSLKADITTNGYYRILNANPGFQGKKGVLFTGTDFKWNTVDKTTLNGVFQIVKGASDGKWILYNCNAKKYFNGVGGVTNANVNAQGSMTLTYLGGGQWNLVLGNGTLHANNHSNGAGTGSNLVNWPTGKNAASAWFIVPATDVEIPLTEVGDASYASAYLPFAVSGVSGAKAYTGAMNEAKDALTLTAATAADAETPLVLIDTDKGSTATLTIGSGIAPQSSTAATGDFLGTLTTLTLSDDTRSNYCLFGKSSTDGDAGFFLPSSSVTEIPANKAYISASAVSASTSGAVRLDFGSVVEGVADALTSGTDAQAPVYDLSGRKVAKAMKGGIYIQGGKKIFVK